MVERLTPEQVVALTIWGESRSGSPMLRKAIASVIQNRADAHLERWGLTARDVCLTPLQFSCWSSAGGQHNYESVMDAVAHLVDKREPQGPVLRECLSLAWHVTGGTMDDVTRNGVFYFAPDAMIPRGRIPTWAIGKSPTAIIDSTHFYGLDAA